MAGRSQEIHRLHATVCKALSDSKRLMILDALRDRELSVGEICETLGLAQANVSQHLAVLRDTGIVRARREAQWVYYTLASTKITEAMDLLVEVMNSVDETAAT